MILNNYLNIFFLFLFKLLLKDEKNELLLFLSMIFKIN